MKDAIFLGTSKADLRGFPDGARRDAGVALHQVQLGLEPTDWKPMPGIGPGVREIRIRAGGAFRVIYLAARCEGVYVLHCFQKKTPKTAPHDIELARQRYKQVGA
ncbi:MAG: type II toxin-antitoxin system RelE/ParE family toxin [Candidatus Methylumidiphilus sp.]